MKNLDEYCGIELFVGPMDKVFSLVGQQGYVLGIAVDPDGGAEAVYYSDPILGCMQIDLSLMEDPAILMNEINTLVQQRQIQKMDDCLMLHLHPEQIRALFPNLIDAYIKSEWDYARDFLARHPDQKFNRKRSGLSHSYEYDKKFGVIQSANKNECRVVWSRTIPTSSIFENLPSDTRAAYVVVQAEEGKSAQLYYLSKEDHVGHKPKLIDKNINLQFFKKFILSHRSLTKNELEEIETLHSIHTPDTSNRLGAGNFAHVKKSYSENHEKIATKIQKTKPSHKFESQHSGRSAEIGKFSAEANIISDLNLGSPHMNIGKNKLKVHMNHLGTPLSQKMPTASFEKKLDYAINFLMKVEELHTGKNAKSGMGYAHRDLKPSNILVDEHEKIELGDYGLATSNLTSKSEEAGGTLFYAPLDQDVIDHYAEKIIQRRSSSKSNPTSFSSDVDMFDSADNALEDWDFNQSEDETSEESLSQPSTDSQDKWSSLPTRWNYCLVDENLCMTHNYLEDDKIAALRVLHIHSRIAQAEDCIFNDKDFRRLPEPIRHLLDSSVVSNILSPERRHETEGFFAAVLIYYKHHPQQTDADYSNAIQHLRDNPELQQKMIDNHRNHVIPKGDLSAFPDFNKKNKRKENGFDLKTSFKKLLGFKSFSDKKEVEKFKSFKKNMVHPSAGSDDDNLDLVPDQKSSPKRS